jgi:hypothetical protein
LVEGLAADLMLDLMFALGVDLAADLGVGRILDELLGVGMMGL